MGSMSLGGQLVKDCAAHHMYTYVCLGGETRERGARGGGTLVAGHLPWQPLAAQRGAGAAGQGLHIAARAPIATPRPARSHAHEATMGVRAFMDRSWAPSRERRHVGLGMCIRARVLHA